MMKHIFLIVSFFFLLISTFGQTPDSTRKGYMRIVKAYARTSTYNPGPGFNPQRNVAYREFIMVGDHIFKINRKNLDPYFKQDPKAFKKWNAYYNYGYVQIGTIAAAIGFVVMVIAKHEKGDRLKYGIPAVSLVGATYILGGIGRYKRKKAIKIYNSNLEK